MDSAINGYRIWLLDDVLNRFDQLKDRKAYDMVSLQNFFNKKSIGANNLYEQLESAATENFLVLPSCEFLPNFKKLRRVGEQT